MAESTKSATLTIGDKTVELPMFTPTSGPDVIDIRKLYAQAGVFTYDPGFTIPALRRRRPATAQSPLSTVMKVS